MVLADSHGISRAPCYLGTSSRGLRDFVYGAVTPYGAAFQTASTISRFCNSLLVPVNRLTSPTTPIWQRHRAITPHRFRLFPFRSPLLRESLLLSIPRGTEMFQFPRLLLPALCVQTGVTGHYPSRVSPFGHPWITACSQLPRAFRRLPRPSSAPDAKASTINPL